ncbi:MAG TPA: hypothetical protein VF252_02140 [Gemmatimonadales bacterium]
MRRNGIVVVPDLESYVALWDSRTLLPSGSDVAENEIYRLRVFLGASELGFVDAKVWRTVGQLLQITRWNEANPTNPYFPLPRNSILPVPFWIGELAVAQARSFDLTGLPPSIVSGATASVTLTVRDADGNVATGYRGTVAFTSSAPDATLPPDYHFTADDAGVHTFAGVSFKMAATGTTLRATDNAEAGLFREISVDVLPGNAASLQLSGLSNPFGAGATGSLTVTALDQNGNTATGYTGTIAFTSNDPLAHLPDEYTFTPEDAGTHVFEDVILQTAGEVTVRAIDNAHESIFGVLPVTVGAVAAATLQLTASDDTPVAGEAGSVTVTARDPSGNVATDYRGTIAFTSSDPLATLPGNYTFTAADAGTHAFPAGVTLRTAGSTTVTATDQAVGTITGSQTVTVTPAAAATLVLAGVPAQALAGVAYDLSITARDPFGNTATGYRGTIHFTSTDPLATIPPDYTFTAEDAGTHSFAAAVILRTAGAASVRVTDNADATIFVVIPVTVAATAAATLRVTGLNDPFEAGTAGSVRVTALDLHGNLAADYTGTIAFASTDPQATLPESYTFSADDAGSHEFSGAVTLRTAGSVTVTATDQAVSTITGSQPVSVTPAAAATLALDGIPPQTTAGVAHDLTVTAKDEFGNTATGYAGTVGFTSNDDAAMLPPAYAFQAGDAGVRSFPGVTFKTAGDRTLQVTDAAAPAITRSLTATVAAAAAAELRFTVQPSGALAGQTIAPPVVVTAYDPFGNLASAFTGQITIAIGTHPSGGVLSGTPQVAAANGAGTFADLSISAAGNGYTLVASAASLASATSEPFNITAPAPVTAHWINPAGGNWSVPANWSTGAVPTSDQTALIDLAGTYTVTLDVNATVNRLSLGAASGVQSLTTANSRTLAILTSGTVLGTGRLNVNNSTINGPGAITVDVDGVMNLSGTNTINAPLVNAGKLFNFNFSALNGGLSTERGSLLEVQSVGFGGAALTVGSGFTNNGTIRITAIVANGSSLIVNGTLTNAVDGKINILGTAGGRTLTAQLDNRGELNVGLPLTISRVGADHTNSGTINVAGGNLLVTDGGATASVTNTGRITVADGRIWSLNNMGSFTQASGATLDGPGAMSLSGTTAVFGTAFTLTSLSLSGVTANFATDITTATLALAVNNSTINGPVTLTNGVGKTLTLTGTVVINTALANAGTIVIQNSTTLNGSVTTEAGSELEVRSVGFGGALLTLASGFTNNGLLELTATVSNGCALTVNGTLTNAAPISGASGGTITVSGVAGGRTITAQLDNQGTFNVGLPLTINRGSADHTNSGTINVTGGDLTVTQSGTTPSFTNTGTINVGPLEVPSPPRTMRISSGPVTNGLGGLVQGGGTFETGTSAPFNSAGTVTVGLMRVGGGLTSTGTFSPGTVEFFGNPATIPVGAGFSYKNVRTIISAVFAASVSLAGDLTVAGPGNLTIGAHEVTVEGNFATQGTSVLTMQNAAGILTVGGNASFGGASTNGRLTAGTFRLAGNFSQGGTSPAGYAATLNHLTQLNGSGPQSVSFANPGTTTALSHFHRLEIQNSSAAGVTLGSAVFANGQLRTPAGPSVARTLSSAGHTLQVGGLDAAGLVLDGTPLRVVNGEGLTRFDDAVFQNLDPVATQFQLDRLADVVTFNNIQFLTTPTTGVYLHLVDTDLAAPLFTVTMQGTQPPNHGGRVTESVAGQLAGWPF